MALATDRDLLILEPNVFRDAAFDSQTPLRATDGALASGVLTSASSDFVAAGAAAGSVVLAGGLPLVVTTVNSAASLDVALVRADGGSPAPPPDGTDLAVRLSTFGPQIDESSRRTRRALGLIETGDPGEPALLESAGVTRLVAIGALELVYAAAATRSEASDPMWSRSAWHGERYRAELRRVAARLDTTGDGSADGVRRTQPTRLVRE